MGEKLILLLTDEEIIFYNGGNKNNYSLEEKFESIQLKLNTLFLLGSKVPFLFLIDRSYQDIREDPLPPLFLWDRLRFLSHKREEWASQNGFYGYHFFKQDGQSFLQWANISQNDSLYSWILWAKGLSNPCEGIRFVPLETIHFIKEKVPSLGGYQLIIYKLGHKARYVIFKGKRLLLYRPFSGEEDLRTSLHFLSRLSSDIYEKLQIVSLVPEISLTFPDVEVLSPSQTFFDFLKLPKKATLSLNIKMMNPNQWLKKEIKILFLTYFIVTSCIGYQYFQSKKETNEIICKIEQLKKTIKHKKTLLKNKNLAVIRSALNHYHYLHSQSRLPFDSLEKLVPVVQSHNLRLQNLTWNSDKAEELIFSFLLPSSEQSSIADHFQAVLFSLREAFPNAQFEIMEAPFRSGVYQTFEYPSDVFHPMGCLRIKSL